MQSGRNSWWQKNGIFTVWNLLHLNVFVVTFDVRNKMKWIHPFNVIFQEELLYYCKISSTMMTLMNQKRIRQIVKTLVLMRRLKTNMKPLNSGGKMIWPLSFMNIGCIKHNEFILFEWHVIMKFGQMEAMVWYNMMLYPSHMRRCNFGPTKHEAITLIH